MSINPDKIRDVIGPGGKKINEIIDETGVKLEIAECHQTKATVRQACRSSAQKKDA